MDEAGAEMAEIGARLGRRDRRAIVVDNFEGIRPADLSPLAWLFLLEGRGEEEAEIPTHILEALFLEIHDPIIRFRLVRGALGQPGTYRRYQVAVERDPEPEEIRHLPDSLPKQRIQQLEELAEGPTEADDPALAQALQEMVLYLLQDGSSAALVLAAGAVAPDQAWRMPARELARNIVRSVDPNLEGYGRHFRRANI
jgi:hypothetical protein